MSIDKIICAGKNYLEHAQELGDAIPETPVIFLKPPSVLKQCCQWGDTLQVSFPHDRGEVHHEIEIVLQVGAAGYQMSKTEADKAIRAVSIGLDMTLRTEQTQLKKKGHPWTTGKVFVDAAIIGPWIPVAQFTDYLNTEFDLVLDETLRQKGRGNQMSFSPSDLLCYISRYFPLCEGDIIFTGTPAGVGAISSNSVASLNWGKYHYKVEWK